MQRQCRRHLQCRSSHHRRGDVRSARSGGCRTAAGSLRKPPLGVVDLLYNGLSAPPHGCGTGRDGPNGEAEHRGRLGGHGEGIACRRQGPVDTCQRAGDVQSVAGKPPLGLRADLPHAGRERRELVGDVDELSVKLLVLEPLEDLVVAVESAVEPVMGAPPKPFAKFDVVPAALPSCAEEAQSRAKDTGPDRGPGPRVRAAPRVLRRDAALPPGPVRRFPR